MGGQRVVLVDGTGLLYRAYHAIPGNLKTTAVPVYGPSIRWGKLFYVSSTLHTFVATSTGLYYTTNINGASTSWIKEGIGTIGNTVATALDFRASDNTLAVST